MAERKILLKGGVGEYEEKKSRFIATLRPVKTAEEAAAFIAEMKKKYWDARHNCSAYVIGKDNALSRCSDDGEPSGTAGMPMLNVLSSSGVQDAAAVVTRYFGGTLLGTGGLVRAYTNAVNAALANSELAMEREGTRLLLAMEYADVDRVLHYMKERDLAADKSDYAADVNMELVVPLEAADSFAEDIKNLSAGRVLCEKLGECVYLEKC